MDTYEEYARRLTLQEMNIKEVKPNGQHPPVVKRKGITNALRGIIIDVVPDLSVRVTSELKDLILQRAEKAGYKTTPAMLSFVLTQLRNGSAGRIASIPKEEKPPKETKPKAKLKSDAISAFRELLAKLEDSIQQIIEERNSAREQLDAIKAVMK